MLSTPRQLAKYLDEKVIYSTDSVIGEDKEAAGKVNLGVKLNPSMLKVEAL